MKLKSRGHIEDALLVLNRNIMSNPNTDVKGLIDRLTVQYNLNSIQQEYLYKTYSSV